MEHEHPQLPFPVQFVTVVTGGGGRRPPEVPAPLAVRVMALSEARTHPQPELPLSVDLSHSDRRSAARGRRRTSRDWRIDDRTRAASRRGLAAAREVLASLERQGREPGSAAHAA